MATKKVSKLTHKTKAAPAPKITAATKTVKTVKAAALKSAPKVQDVVKALALKASAKTTQVKVISVAKTDPGKPAVKAAVKSRLKAAPALKTLLNKEERIHSHPTMCLHCHLIVEMFHERGADPVKGAWQCPRCAHKYLFSHWKIKRQARSKSEAA